MIQYHVMSFPLLPALAAFIPRDRVDAILTPQSLRPQSLRPRRPFAQDGIALIADISGFTPLTEALTQGLKPDQGAEELTRALESVFTPLIAEIHAFQGSVIKFGGDALIVWFGRAAWGRRTAVARRALTAAWRMQQVMQQHGQVPTPLGPVTLRMKIGMAYGPTRRFRLGLPEYGYEDVLVGATLDRMAAAEHQAEPGDIMLDTGMLSWVQQDVTVAAWREGAALLGELRRPARPSPWPPLYWQADDAPALAPALAPYVPAPIYEALLAGREQVAELKPVVSLFVQFHGLDYDADPAVGDQLQTYFVAAQRVVYRFGGRLNRLITGDKGSLLHIIFGAPRSVEEQEARAVRCALALQTACRQLPFITMQRIGIAAGRVFAGPVGSPLRHDYTTMGDAINLSARLMQAAADNQTLLAHGVRAQLGAEFELADLGQIRVKGKAEPIAVFAAVGVQERQRRARAARLPPLFGRGEETAVFQNAIAQLHAGQGQVLTLIGDVGLGKSLLLDHVQAWAEAAWETATVPGLWAAGINLVYEQSISGYLFISVLRDLLRLPPGAGPDQASHALYQLCHDLFGAERVDAVYPYLARFMGLPLRGDMARRLDGVSGESVRWQLFELLPALLHRLCQRQPVVLALDDMQWSDPTSWQLLQTLRPLTKTSPLLLLLAARPEGATRPEGAARMEVDVATALTLRPLSSATAAALIRYHTPELPPDVIAYLVEKGGGNPLFLVELARTLRTQRAQQTQQTPDQEMDGTAWQLDALDLPDSVQGLLLAQLDRLATEARHTLQLASVIGKTFLHQVLTVITGAARQLDGVLAELETQEFIQTVAATDMGRAHTFRHGLIQESAYNTLLYERRREYHRQVAQTVERLFPAQVAQQAAVLAYHYEQAGELETAVAYLMHTADQARLLSAHEEAETLYGRVLALLSQLAGAADRSVADRQARIYLKLGQVYANRLDFAGAQAFYEQAFALFAQAALPAMGAQPVRVPEAPPFRWPLLDQTTPFDPGLVETGEVAEVVANLFEGLVELDDEWNVIPALARRWSVLAAGQRYRFTLRDGLRWSDGRPLTAHDFVFAWRRNLHPQTGAGMAYQLYVVAGAEAFHQGTETNPETIGIRALDGQTLEIALERPTPYFPYLLADPVSFPLPAHTLTEHREMWTQPERLVCNGPFYLSQVGDERQLRRNPQYRGLALGNVTQVRLVPGEPTLSAYEQDDIDWCRVDDRADVPALYPDESLFVQQLSTFILGFACGGRPFKDARARRAFAASIDTRALVAEVWAGVQRPASGGIIPPGMPGHSPEIGVPFDPEAGRRLLAEMGWGAERPSLRLAALPGFGQTPHFLQAAWRRHLGVDVEILMDMVPGAALAALAQGDIQMVLLGVGLIKPDPTDCLYMLAHSRGPFNYFGWRSGQFDAYLEQAAQTADQQQRLANYRLADRLLVAEEVALVPLYHLQAYGVLRAPFTLAAARKIARSGAMKFKHLRVRDD